MWKPDESKILTSEEVRQVLDDLAVRCVGSHNARVDRVIFCLAAGSGLRATEICRITMGDVKVGERCTIRIRKGVGKGGRPRVVQVLDRTTAAVLGEWKRDRQAADDQPFIVSRTGRAFGRFQVRKRFQTACRSLGRHVTTHSGRHSYVSHSLASGVSLAGVQASAGHSNASVTGLYIHVAREEASRDIFA
jgi:integrase/recombinase XerD